VKTYKRHGISALNKNRSTLLLTTERLHLREFQENDWHAVLEYQTDPLYLRYYPATQVTERDARDFVRRCIAWSMERPRKKFQLAFVLRSNGRLIGNGGIRMRFSDTWEAEMGYELDSRYWGQGYATEAARALLAFGFDELALHRIWAQCVLENLASARVLERIGMRREGHMRENEWMKGRWWDTLHYAILDSEWHHMKSVG
jgi:[ribosomal protein S5]-alanine N-acetyltransferase